MACKGIGRHAVIKAERFGNSHCTKVSVAPNTAFDTFVQSTACLRSGVMPFRKPFCPQHMEFKMSKVQSHEKAASGANGDAVEMKLEVVVLPVADVDRAKRFYANLGWRLDADFANADGLRVVQLTPPGSPCSVIFGKNVTAAAPGSVHDLMLVVSDIETARAHLIAKGVEVSAVFHDAGGVFHHAGTAARVQGPDPQRRSYCSWASFSDPDGNGWLLQEVTTRLPGRV